MSEDLSKEDLMAIEMAKEYKKMGINNHGGIVSLARKYKIPVRAVVIGIMRGKVLIKAGELKNG